MKSHVVRFVYVVALILVALATVAFSLAQVPTPAPVTVDWSQVLTQVLAAVVPIVAAALVGQAIVIAKYFWAKLEAERPDIVNDIQSAAMFAVPAMEQLKKSGVIPSGQEAKRLALSAARAFLLEKGWSQSSVMQTSDILDNAIEAAVHYLPPSTPTTAPQ